MSTTATTAKSPGAPLPPTPKHLLRSHVSPITALAWSNDNERLYSADGSGKVIVTSTRSLRPITSWQAHTDSILGVEEWDKFILTHARDNKIHVWQRVLELPFSARIGASAGLSDLPTPLLCYSMDVNALNFCRFSLLKLPHNPSDKNSKPRAFIAVPNLVDSTTADVWSLPSVDRVHAAIGQESNKSPAALAANPSSGRNTSGIIMSMNLFYSSSSCSTPRKSSGSSASSSNSSPSRLSQIQNQTQSQHQINQNLCILLAYENGSVILRQYTRSAKEASIEGQGWEVLWKSKLHVESIMAMRVSRTNDFALTVSADHIIGRYDLSTTKSKNQEEYGTAFRTKHPGNGSIAIRDDGRVCAVGGWDGKIRLYSTKSFKALGTLKYHKTAVQCVEFARAYEPGSGGDSNNNSMTESRNNEEKGENEKESDDEEEISADEKMERSRWVVAGGKDNRVSIWELMSFEK